MIEEKTIRINKVLRELNISLDTAVSFLNQNGFNIEASPNAKISNTEYTLLQNHIFSKPKVIIDLERHYKIKLSPLNNRKLAYSQTSNTYILDAKNEVLSLDMSRNEIFSIEYLKKFHHLKYLDLGDNPIDSLEPLKEIKTLEVLRLWHIGAGDYSFLTELPNLKELVVSGNSFDDDNFPIVISKLINIEILDVGGNYISDLNFLIPLSNIKILHANNNLIQNLSPLVYLKKLSELTLSNNQIENISPLSELENLSSLSLTKNKIKNLEPISTLTKLRDLFIADNYIESISSLEEVIMNLKFLDIDNNPLNISEGWKFDDVINHLDTVKNYLSNLKHAQKTYNLPVKVLLLGNHASGKSTLLNYLLDENQPKVLKAEKNSTHIIRIEKQPKKISRGELPKTIYFDFGGQDYYHGLYKAFLTNDTLNLLLWNYVSDNNQLRNDTRDFSREYWLYQLKHYFNKNKRNDETEPILLIQTRADEIESKRKNFNDDYDEFSIKNEFYISLNNDYLEKDKTSKASLKFLEVSIEDEISKKRKSIQRPIYYGNFINSILTSDSENCKSIDDVKKFYKRPRNANETEKDIIDFLKDDLDQLHKQGLILYYKEFLPDVIWLNPMKTIQYIHDSILSKDKLKRSKGKIKESDFKHDSNIIELLKLQKVIFHDAVNKNYIIPNYLPLTNEHYDYDIITFGIKDPGFTLKFLKFLPFGLVNQFICHFGNNPDAKYFWRDQIVFTLNKESKILIKLDFTNLEISVYFHFLTDDVKKKEIIKKYIFNCIIAIYWDVELIDFQDYCNYKSVNPFKSITSIDIGKIANYDELSEAEQKQFNLSSELQIKIQSFMEQTDCFPEDMFISVDSKNFINSNEFLGKINSNEIYISAYTQDEDGKINMNASKEKLIFNYRLFTNKTLNRMKKIFISYSNEDFYFKKQLEKHLRPLSKLQLAKSWSCEEMTPGLWDDQIKDELISSDIVIFMLSINFMASDYILKEELFKVLLDIKNNPEKNIICVLVRDFSWRHYDRLFDLTGLSKDLKNGLNDNDQMATAIGTLPTYQFVPYEILKDKKDTQRYLKAVEEWEFESKAYTAIMDEVIKIL